MREMAVRQALGAVRWRLVSLLLAETLLVTIAAAGFALLAVRVRATAAACANTDGRWSGWRPRVARGPRRRRPHGSSLRDRGECIGVDDRRRVAGVGRLASAERCDADGVGGQGRRSRRPCELRLPGRHPGDDRRRPAGGNRRDDSCPHRSLSRAGRLRPHADDDCPDSLAGWELHRLAGTRGPLSAPAVGG
jgi:hypothetical protein